MSDLQTGSGPFFNSAESEFIKNQGWENAEVWEGTEAEVRAKQQEFIGRGATRVRVNPKGNGAWLVRAVWPYNTNGGDNTFVDTMELETNAILRSAYQAPRYRARFSDYIATSQFSAKAYATLGPISDCVRKYQSGLPKQEEDAPNAGKFAWRSLAGVKTYVGSREAAIEAELGNRLTGLGIGGNEYTSAFQLFYNLAYRGVTGFLEYNSVFRRTVTAGSPFAVRANMTGAGRIWTTAEVIAFEGIPNDGWFDLPVGSQWHKDKPRILSVYGQKTQLTYSYTEVVTASALFYQAQGSAVLVDT